jgi:acyl transferase domain-containing protein/NADPH:quinone reductase-like Zn-dependent oxidoreductase/acyl carrier protein
MSDVTNRLASLSPAKKQLLKERLAASEAVREPIAIVGMACRFPGASSLEEYWRLISEGRNARSVVPSARWDAEMHYDKDPDQPGRMLTKWGCFLDEIGQFDPAFFGISPREGSRMDPQQRLLLHTAWEAIEHAGIDSQVLAASPTGVFIGVGQFDYPRVMSQYDDSLNHLDAHCATGSALSICSNRLSYAFNFSGPSVSVDTACSSALVAVHQAVQSLRKRECNAALAGGVNVVLTPEANISLSKARMLSTTGWCRPFDAAANGYVRGEGCGVVVLKRLSDAISDGDRVMAVIRGTAVNHGGRTSGITAPNGQAQRKVIEAAMADGGIRSEQVGYIEAHGTGTPLGDPIEVEALATVFGKATDKSTPVYLTSVKANIGHTEVAAGIAGLIKAAMIVQRGRIAPQISLDHLNPHLNFHNSRVTIPLEPVDWSSTSDRIAGVSSFGFGGTNSHVVIQSADPGPAGDSPASKSGFLLTLSCRSEAAVRQLAERYGTAIADLDEQQLGDFCFTAGRGRTQFTNRAAIYGKTKAELIEDLKRLSRGERSPSIKTGKAASRRLRTAALFTGQGSQYLNMGMGLYETEPAFREAFDKCDSVLKSIRGKSLLAVIRGKAADCSLDSTEWTQPALFSVEYSLAQLWKSRGVIPDVLLGHSIGEYVAACVAGVFDLETGLKLIAERSRLMQALPAGGAMAVLFAPGDKVVDRIKKYPSYVSVAAFNGPENTTISGTEHAVKRAMAEAAEFGAPSQILEVSHAFHSPLMEPMLDQFEAFAKQFNYHAPQIPIASNLTGRIERGAIFDAKYWRNHARKAVRFSESVESLVEDKVDCLIEMGPTSTLLGMARRCVDNWKPAAFPSLRKGSDDLQVFYKSIAEVWVRGHHLEWNGTGAGRGANRIDIPGHPMDQQRYWFEPESATTHMRDFVFGLSHVTPILGTRASVANAVVFENRLTSFSPRYLKDHQVTGAVLLPGSAVVEMALGAARAIFGDGCHSAENISFRKGMFLSDRQRVVQLHVTGSGNRRTFKVYSRPMKTESDAEWDLNATGEIVREERTAPSSIDVSAIEGRQSPELTREEYYGIVSGRGLNYGPAFQVNGCVRRGDGEAISTIQLDQSVIDDLGKYSIHPAVGDGCLQAMTGVIPLEHDGSFCPDLYLPVSIQRVTSYMPILSSGCFYARRTSEASGPSPASVEADILIVSPSGEVLAEFKTARVQKVGSSERNKGADPRTWLYQTEWRRAEQAAEPDKTPRNVLIFSDDGGFAEELKDQLKPIAERTEFISFAAPEATQPSRQERQLSITSSATDIQRVLSDIVAGLPSGSPVDIVLCRGLQTPEPKPQQIHEIQQSQQIWVQTFEILRQIATTTFPGRVSVWLLTRGANSVADGDIPALNQLPLIGLGQSAAVEMWNQNCRLIDLNPTQSNQTNVRHLIMEMSIRDAEPAIAFRDNARWVRRLVRTPEILDQKQKSFSATVPTDSEYRVRLGNDDTIDGLQFERMPRSAPGRGQIKIAVRAAGLNFSDVLKAIGLYPGITDEIVPLGLECSGVISEVGEGVTRFKAGDEVMGIAPYCFASHCVTTELAVVKKPEFLKHEEAATIPLAFLTAYYCLQKVAHLQPGERVLIHAGAGGVGLAAIQIAQEIGAEIFATAGSEEKREYLRSLGVQHVLSSRSLEFADQIRDITKGEGVDVVLNSLPGEAIEKSLSTLRAYGRFVEIGKVDIYQNRMMGLLPFQDNLSYTAVDLDRLFRQRPEVANALISEIIAYVNSGKYRPLNMTVLPIEEIVGAFRYMSQRRNIGKVIVSIAPVEVSAESKDFLPSTIRKDGTYLITGGLGSLGFTTVEWLVSCGAGAVVLLSRRSPDSELQQRLEELNRGTARVIAVAADVCDRASLDHAIANLPEGIPPVRGVFHAAGVLRDMLITKMGPDDFAFPLGPKTIGTWNLHSAFLNHDLDLFVLFSSVSSILGTAGQCNYGAANAFLDGFVAYRRRNGMPATVINWGAFAGDGMAAAVADDIEARGMSLLPLHQSIELMKPILAAGVTQVTVFRADWSILGRLMSGSMSGELKYRLTEDLFLASEESSAPMNEVAVNAVRAEVLALKPEDRHQRMAEFLTEQLAEIMGMDPKDIDPAESLNTIGLDSLMAIELGNKMLMQLGIELPMSVYLEGPNVNNLSRFVCEKIAQSEHDSSVLKDPALVEI